ncbi:ligand-gated ion channel [Brevundimonas bacteroides]|uniref:hypothetical protein n=1 Tax=Brevundimonas bacteroides TaxID=74311 RepID=UPI000497DFBD|nr:hypothetical protein [Brevundimonas bacteroides]
MRIKAFLLAMLLWIGVAPAQAQEGDTSERPPQTVCSVGVYLSDLYDIDTRSHRFGADVWAWSVCTGEKNALQSAEWINAQEQTQSLEYADATDFGLWSQRKITGVYRQNFDVRSYPFDRHTLRMIVEDSYDTASTLQYIADDRRSTVSRNLRLDGWTITRFAVESREEVYGTAFGDPTLPDDQQTLYPHMEVVIDIERSNLWTFWKLVAPLYIASALTLLTFLMHDEEGKYLSPRLGLLAGVLFAIVLNMRAVEEVVGETNGLSLMDNIHLMALFLAVLAIAAATAWTFLTRNGWGPARVRRWDKGFFFAGTGVYIAANAALIGAAVQAG